MFADELYKTILPNIVVESLELLCIWEVAD
jgi:hypothetical protein